MTNVIEDLIEFIADAWENWRDRDKKISLKFISTIANITIDFVYSISDIWDTWKEKDEKLLSKIICIISTIIFFIIGIGIWLK